jgi:hypothetical protein
MSLSGRVRTAAHAAKKLQNRFALSLGSVDPLAIASRLSVFAFSIA